MPTKRPRYIITETDPVALALADAAERWPEDRDNRTRLLIHLIEEGSRAVRRSHDEARARALAAIEATAGCLTGVYRPDELEKLREDWPE